ncbi:MAG: DUF512 domain-containing protein, partial [Gemmatimonadales bacterium]
LRAGLELPPPAFYGRFDQAENGVGAVRFLQSQIAEAADRFAAWRGKRIAVVTGMSMGPLMPQVLTPLTEASGATFELFPVENTLFGPRVTTAGLLPGRDLAAALGGRRDFDLVLLPGEAVNDHDRLIDDLPAPEVAAAIGVPVRFAKTFVDALDE